MSGICGIVSQGGAPIDPSGLHAMIGMIAHRGPDGTSHWFDDRAALGHAALWTTPESLDEPQPFRHAESGCVITADARLDNREALFERLAIDRSAHGMGDAELILRCYLEWGCDCAAHLMGDFAFAIWDARARRLLAARDHMGVRQLSWWHRPGKAFVFASEPQALFSSRLVPFAINEGAVADYLDNLSAPTHDSTWFTGVSRLPPGHVLTIGPQGLNVAAYWQLEPEPEERSRSFEETSEGLRSVLRDAVACRLRSAGPIGATLSGGMDSGSVCALASQLLANAGRSPLMTFSGIGPDPASCIESRSIAIASQMPGLDPHLLGFAEMADHIARSGGLFSPAMEPVERQMVVIRALYHAARQAGVKVMLDGVFGDVAFAAGNSLERLISRGKWLKAASAAKGAAQFWHPYLPAPKALVTGMWNAAVPFAIRERRSLRLFRQAAERLQADSLVSADLAARTGLTERRMAKRPPVFRRSQPACDERARIVSRIESAEGNQIYDQVASRQGIERRDPFSDIRVIRYCLSIPAEMVESNGWPKNILRDAMAGIVPDEIRWRTGKQHIGRSFLDQLVEQEFDKGMAFQSSNGILRQYVSPFGLGIVENDSAQIPLHLQQLMLASLASWMGGIAGAAVEIRKG